MEPQAEQGRLRFEETIAQLRGLRVRAQGLYRHELRSMVDYKRELGSRTVIAKSANAVEHEASDPTDYATCTSFVAMHLATPGVAKNGRVEPAWYGASFVGSYTYAVLTTIVSDFQQMYRIDGDRFVAALKDEAKQEAELPHPYNTSIHVSGLATALTELAGDWRSKLSILRLGFAAAGQIARWLAEDRGYVAEHINPSVPAHASAFNPYLSYWCVRALVSWLDFNDRLAGADLSGVADELRSEWDGYLAAARDALSVSVEAHLDYLSRIVVANHAGIGTTFDADDLVCMIASSALASHRLNRRDEFAEAVLAHAIDVLLGGYVHSDGSYVPNAPVLDPRRGSSVTLASEELNAILLHAVGQDLSVGQALGFAAALEHTERKSRGPRGWGGSGSGDERRNAFVSSAALSFLHAYQGALDRLIADLCLRELGAGTPMAGLERFELPSQAQAVYDDDVSPLAGRHSDRNLAVTSIVLGGPRSMPKERIAHKFAQLLEWPALSFDPVSFLGDETSGLDVEIRRNLDLLSEVSNAVVYFDALDDWMLAPSYSAARRLLSWSMLSRLDQLTSFGRILLVIACENPARLRGLIDDRAGRIDKVIMLEAPTPAERKKIIDQLADTFGAGADVLRTLESTRVVEKTDGLTEGFLRELVRSCVAKRQRSGKLTTAMVSDILNSLHDQMRRGDDHSE